MLRIAAGQATTGSVEADEPELHRLPQGKPVHGGYRAPRVHDFSLPMAGLLAATITLA